MNPLALIDQFAPYIEDQVKLITESEQEAEAFSGKLSELRDGLLDAERQGVTDPAVKRWLNKLEGVMFQMEDVLDESASEILKLQIEEEEKDLASLLMSLCLCCNHVWQRREIALSMKGLTKQLDDAIAEKGKFQFSPNDSPRSEVHETTSYVNELKLIGRRTVKENLVKRLLSEWSGAGARIIPIVGTGGVGKTTLAQLAFHHPLVEKHFGRMRAWVSVPNPCDDSYLVKSILKELGNSFQDPSASLNTLVGHLKEIVSKKPFLIVLDNLLIENEVCKSLSDYLCNEPGGRVLVTTRNEGIARMMGGDEEWKPLSLLSNSDCGRILNQIALAKRTEEDKKILQVIGFKIAEKCNGLPLVAKAMGSMLASKDAKEDWDDVLNSPLWEYSEDGMSDVFRSLNVSYVNLPLHLKRCFLSCPVFSKGDDKKVDDLIRVWMAQGYLDSSLSFKDIRIKGIKYFRELVDRSFFLEFDEVTMSYKMHDAMHDFATHLANNNGYCFVYDALSGEHNSSSSKVALNSAENIRFFIARGALQKEIPPSHTLIGELHRVRQLILSNCNLKELPPEIRKLIHLRYLDVSKNDSIEELPEAVYDLCNLQTLNIDECSGISRLPDGIERLKKLRHLFLCLSVMEYPQGFEKLVGNLWTINRFVATRDSVSLLENSNQFHRELKISFRNLKEAADVEEAKKANVRGKHQIESLGLYFGKGLNIDIIDTMIPPPQIQSLTVWGDDPYTLPRWITSLSSLVNSLKELYTYGFKAHTLPCLGKLPLLEKLSISRMDFKTITAAFWGNVEDGVRFPRLKLLVFWKCWNWEEWEDESGSESESEVMLPCLEELMVSTCMRLQALPHRLLRKANALKTLSLHYCLSLKGDARADLPHIPNIIVEDQVIF